MTQLKLKQRVIKRTRMTIVFPLLAHVAYVKTVVYLLKKLRTRPREDEALVVLSPLQPYISYSNAAKVQLRVEWIWIGGLSFTGSDVDVAGDDGSGGIASHAAVDLGVNLLFVILGAERRENQTA